MSKIAKSLTDLIGNTPLLELSNYGNWAPPAASQSPLTPTIPHTTHTHLDAGADELDDVVVAAERSSVTSRMNSSLRRLFSIPVSTLTATGCTPSRSAQYTRPYAPRPQPGAAVWAQRDGDPSGLTRPSVPGRAPEPPGHSCELAADAAAPSSSSAGPPPSPAARRGAEWKGMGARPVRETRAPAAAAASGRRTARRLVKPSSRWGRRRRAWPRRRCCRSRARDGSRPRSRRRRRP